MHSFLGSPRGGRSLGRLAVTTALVLAAACGKGDSGAAPVDPVVPGEPTGNPRFRAAAFIFDVNTAEKTVAVLAPSGGVINASLEGNEDGTPNYSILAGDVVQLSTSNYQASAVGAFTPGKIRVTFDVNITNRISSINLITPTFPAPPAGVTGVLLFPFEAATIVSTGGATPGGDGTDIIVEQPSRGAVAPSIDFDGEPFNFFNDGACAAGNNDDCYRYQTYAQPLLGGGTSESQTVGFDIDPTVYRFRTRLIVAADIQQSGGAASGSISGTVTSNIGALSGVSIAVTGGLSATTGAAGDYSIASVPVGPKTVSVSGGLPAGCTLNAPTTVAVTVPNGGSSTASFVATCPTPSFTLSGSVTSNQGALVGATVAASTGGSTATAAGGAYSLSLPVAGGAGTLTVTGIPAGCTLNAGSDLTYPATAVGGSVTRDLVYTCPVPGANSVRGTWTVNAAAGTAALRIGLTVTTGDIASFTQEFRIPAGSGLTYTGATVAGNAFAAGGGLLSVTPPASNPTTIVVAGIVDPGLTGNNLQVVVLNFSYTGSGVVNFISSDGTPGNPLANFELRVADNASLINQLPQFDNNVSIDALTRP
jgi:hypothetical protein